MKEAENHNDRPYGGNSTAGYANEHLIPLNKKLLGAAVARKKKTVGWKFVWTGGGKVFARKNEDSPALKITCVGDVEKMTN